MIPTGEPSMGCAVCAWVPIGEVDRHVGDSRGGRGRLAAGYRRGVRLKRFLRRRILLALAVVVVLGGAGGFIYTRVASGATVTYRTAAAQLGTVIQSVSLSGNLTPTQESNLDFGSSGRVTAVDVQPGQSVTTGATLATIDPTLLNAQLAEAQANLASAQAKLALDQAGSSISTDETSVSNAKVSLDNTLASDKLKISQAEAAVTDAQDAYNADGCAANGSATGCSGPSGATATLQNDQDNLESTQISATQAQDQAEAQVTSTENALTTAQLQQPAQIEEDQAAVEGDQVTVQSAQTAVTGATITAPSAGEVAEVNIVVGESVTGSSNPTGSSSSSSSSSSATYAVVLITPGDFEVTGSVSDAQVDEIALGQSAYVTPAGTTQTYTGSVTEVAPVATISGGVATFPVTVTISGTHDELKSGMSASVSVTVSQAVGVLTVPTSAVSNTGGSSSVRVMDNGVVETVPVTVGASDAEVTQILSGISTGEQVVIATVSSSIPSSTSTGTTGRSGFAGLGGGGGFTGGGGFAGRGGGGG